MRLSELVLALLDGNCFTEVADPSALVQACDRWIYTACLCFGLDLDEQRRRGFCYGYSVYQAEYSRNLLFRSGAQMEDLFDRIVDRTRSRLDIPAVRDPAQPQEPVRRRRTS